MIGMVMHKSSTGRSEKSIGGLMRGTFCIVVGSPRQELGNHEGRQYEQLGTGKRPAAALPQLADRPTPS
jgi:hypothetical protein